MVPGKTAQWPDGPPVDSGIISPLVKGCCHSQPLVVPHSCCMISVRLLWKSSHPMADCWALAPPISSAASQLMTAVPHFSRPSLCPWGALACSMPSHTAPVCGLLRHRVNRPIACFFVNDGRATYVSHALSSLYSFELVNAGFLVL